MIAREEEDTFFEPNNVLALYDQSAQVSNKTE